MAKTASQETQKSEDTVYVERSEDLEIKNQMEKIVGSYDSYMRKITLGREKALREMTVDLARVKPGDSVLEAGCGTGTLTLEAKRKAGPSGNVSGIDIIPGMIDISRRKAKEAELDVTFRLGSIDNIPFSENQFDAVMCSFMIFHMSEEVRRKGIEEIYRVLKPGGYFLALDISLPVNPIPRAFAKIFLGSMFKHDMGELLPLMNESGFLESELQQVKFRIWGMPVLSYVRGRK